MARRVNTKNILSACLMSFDGYLDAEIAQKLGTTEPTISRWRRLEIWKEYEAELINAYKQELKPMHVTPS